MLMSCERQIGRAQQVSTYCSTSQQRRHHEGSTRTLTRTRTRTRTRARLGASAGTGFESQFGHAIFSSRRGKNTTKTFRLCPCVWKSEESLDNRDMNAAQLEKNFLESSSSTSGTSTRYPAREPEGEPQNDGEEDGYEYKNGFGKTPKAEQERRDKISALNKGRAPWNVGVPHRVETRRKIRQSLSQTYANNPQLAEKVKLRNLGRKHTPETKEKIRKSRLHQEKLKVAGRQKRKAVNEIWFKVLCIDERRRHLYYSRKQKLREEKERKKMRLKRRPKQSSSSAQHKGPSKSEEHKRKISEALKKKWATAEFRGKVERGIAVKQRERQGLQRLELRTGNKEYIQTAKLNRRVMRKKQEKLMERATQLLAMAHEAAEHLKTMDAQCLEERGEHHSEAHHLHPHHESNGAMGNNAHTDDVNSSSADQMKELAEIQEALRSLNDADAMMARLDKLSKH